MTDIDWNQFTSKTPTSSSIDWNQFTQSKNTESPLPIIENKDTNNGNIPSAVIAGASNFGANILEGGVDIVSWVGEKLGQIDPKIANQMRKDVKDDTDKWLRSSEETKSNDIFAQSAKQYPITTKGTEIALNLGALSRTAPSVFDPQKIGVLKALLGNTAIQTPINALLGAGISGIQGSNQNQGAAIAATLTPAINTIGAGLGAGARLLDTKLNLTNKLKDAINPVLQTIKQSGGDVTDMAAQSITTYANKAKEIANETWNKIKDISGTINSTPIQASLSSTLKTFKDSLESNQSGVLKDLLSQSKNLQTMDDAIKFKQSLSASSKLFQLGSAPDTLVKNYKNIKAQVDDAIKLKAEQAGLLGDWRLANNFHKEVIIPLQDFNAFDIASSTLNKETNPVAYAKNVKTLLSTNTRTIQQTKALLNSMDSDGSKIMEAKIVKDIFNDLSSDPQSFNNSTALKKLNQIINKYDGTLSTDSINTLKGIKKVLTDAGIETSRAGAGVIGKDSTYAAHTIGGIVGGTVGATVGMPGLGAGIGVATAPMIIRSLQQLVESPKGLALLKGIGQGRPWSKYLGQILKTAPSSLAQTNENQ